MNKESEENRNDRRGYDTFKIVTQKISENVIALFSIFLCQFENSVYFIFLKITSNQRFYYSKKAKKDIAQRLCLNEKNK